MLVYGMIATIFLFLSILLILGLILRAFYLVIRRRWAGLGRTVAVLGIYLLVYGIILATVGMASPRRVLEPGQPECFDEWCAAVLRLTPAEQDAVAICPAAGDEQVWVVTLEVSSQAKRVRQRELGIQAYLEDESGNRYAVCGQPQPDANGVLHGLSDALDPGDSFQVRLAYAVPQNAGLAGIVISHGLAPGKLIIGDDESLFHQETLLKAYIN